MSLSYPSLQLQYNLPPSNHVNKEFFKTLLRGEKKVFKVTDVKPIIVPKLDELSVKNMQKQIENDLNIREYFPEYYYKQLAPERCFFFTTINTIYPGFIPSLINGANKQRGDVTSIDMAKQVIEVTDDWVRAL